MKSIFKLRFKEHAASNDHVTATQRYLERLASKESIVSSVSSHHKKQVLANRGYLTVIFQIIIWLCKQGNYFKLF